MIKTATLPTTIMLAMLTLTGCASMTPGIPAAYEKDMKSMPVLDDPNASKAKVLAALGQPSSRTRILGGRGECFNYTRKIDGKATPFYVGFDQKDAVIGAGYDENCAEADKDGAFAESK